MISIRDHLGWLAVVPIICFCWHLWQAGRHGAFQAPKGVIRRTKEPAKFWFSMLFTFGLLAFSIHWLAGWVAS
jgi:hypothetical protein